MERRLTVAVAGAGIAGLACAALLGRMGHKVRIFEPARSTAPPGPPVVLTPLVQPVLESLGIARGVAELGTPIRRLLGEDATGRTLFDAELGAAQSIERDLLDALLRAAAEEAGAGITSGAMLLGIDTARRDQDGRILDGRHVRLDLGQEDGPFDLVINAGGAQSALSTPMRSVRYGHLWAITPLEPGLDPGDVVRHRIGTGAQAMLLPLAAIEASPARVMVSWRMTARARQRWLLRDYDGWIEETERLWPDLGFFLERIGGKDQFFCQQTGWRWQAMRDRSGTVHLGDAAHLAPPGLWFGASEALRDAGTLALCCATEGNLDSALTCFTRIRSAQLRPARIRARCTAPLMAWGGITARLLLPRLVTTRSLQETNTSLRTEEHRELPGNTSK